MYTITVYKYSGRSVMATHGTAKGGRCKEWPRLCYLYKLCRVDAIWDIHFVAAKEAATVYIIHKFV